MGSENEVAEALEDCSEWDYEEQRTEHEIELTEAAGKRWEQRDRRVRR